MFCRHNRMTARCPICSREQEAELRAKLPQRPPRTRSASARKPAAARAGTAVRTRRLERAPDDGYRNALVPGLRATADAERLAGALSHAAARLEPPGPYPIVADLEDREDAAWLAFLFALAGPDAPDAQAAILEAAPRWGVDDTDSLPLSPEQSRTAGGYRAWVARYGSQAAALTGETRWAPAQRFGRVFERLALPGFPRAARYEFLNTLGAAGVIAVEADGIRLAGDEDAATVAAKRVLLSGDRMLLERRARELACATEVPLGALDRGLAVWEAGGGADTPSTPAAVQALGL